MGGERIESHLAFTDDIFVFLRASKKSFRAVKTTLAKFWQFSGLMVNEWKSFIVYSKKVNDYQDLGDILGFLAATLPIKYLGSPITGRKVRQKIVIN